MSSYAQPNEGEKKVTCLKTRSAADGWCSFPCSSIVSHPAAAREKGMVGGGHTHGWSAPHGPTLCGLRPTSDSSGSQLGRTAHILCAFLLQQTWAGTVYCAMSSSEERAAQLASSLHAFHFVNIHRYNSP